MIMFYQVMAFCIVKCYVNQIVVYAKFSIIVMHR